MIERFWLEIAQKFPERHKILCFPELGNTNPTLSAAGIEIVQFDFNFQKPIALYKFCRRHDIGLIYFTDRPYTSFIYYLLRRAKVQKIVIHDHTPGERTTPAGIKRIVKALNAHVFGADTYIACSDQVLARLTNVGCLPAHRCYLAQNGIDLMDFANAQSSIRTELSLPPDRLLVVSCSRVHPYKRITDIIDAAAQLRNAKLHFIHIGDGPELFALRRKIHALNLDNQFTLLGRRDDVANILSGCDIGVHASDGEVGLCLAILEFMASGLATVITNQPSVSGIIEPGVTGLTFRHRDITSLSETLRRLANDRTLRQQLGLAARAKINSNYSIENTISSVIYAITQTLYT